MKTVLVTGGSKGIGFATAAYFVDKNFNVIISGRNEQRLREAEARLGDNSRFIVWDVSDTASSRKIISTAHHFFGDIDIFINNAGVVCEDDIGRDCVGFFEKTVSGWDKTMNINLKGMYFAIQAEAEYMKDRGIKGNIVNVCSETGFRPASYPYAISKWGVRGMTEGIAVILAKYGIVLNGIAPGETATEILKQREGEIKKIDSPRGVQASPNEIAEAIFFLSQSRNIIGEILVSDGGRRLH